MNSKEVNQLKTFAHVFQRIEKNIIEYLHYRFPRNLNSISVWLEGISDISFEEKIVEYITYDSQGAYETDTLPFEVCMANGEEECIEAIKAFIRKEEEKKAEEEAIRQEYKKARELEESRKVLQEIKDNSPELLAEFIEQNPGLLQD